MDDQPLGYFCPECHFPGSIEEFQTNNDDLAPDLASTGICPDCGAFIEDMDQQGFD